MPEGVGGFGAIGGGKGGESSPRRGRGGRFRADSVVLSRCFAIGKIGGTREWL